MPAVLIEGWSKIIDRLVEVCFVATVVRLVSYLVAAKWYPILGFGDLPSFWGRLPIFLTILALVVYWMLLYYRDYKNVKDDSFLGELQLLLSWVIVLLCFEVAFELVEFWVLAVGVGASVAYFKNRQLYHRLDAVAQKMSKEGKPATEVQKIADRSKYFKRWKNIAAPYALCGLGIGVLAWFILSLEPQVYSGLRLPLLEGEYTVGSEKWIASIQLITHYVCMLLVTSFIIRGIYLARKKSP